VVDGVGSRLTRALVNLSFLGWGPGVGWCGQLEDSLVYLNGFQLFEET
jgi:hypothetical protein